MKGRFCACVLICMFTLLQPSIRTNAQSRPYFADKTVQIVVPFAPGGGADIFARHVARFLGRHLSGKPNVIVINQPGGGGLVAANSYVKNVRRDGLTLLTVTSGLLVRLFMRTEGVLAELSDLTPLVSSPQSIAVYVSPSVRLSSVEDLRGIRDPLTIGLSGDPVNWQDVIYSLEVLKIPYRVIQGYSGTSEQRLAFERGETNLDAQFTIPYMSTVEPLEREGKAVPLYTVGLMDEKGRVVRDPVLSRVPTLVELYSSFYGVDPSGHEWEAYRAVLPVRSTHTTLWIHADTPEAVLQELRRAVFEMSKDHEFIKANQEVLKGYGVIVGGELDSVSRMLSGIPPSTLAWMKAFLGKRFNVRFRD